MVFCYGVLYHVSEPEAAIAYLEASCADLLLLETIVSFGTGESINPWKEDPALAGAAVSGLGCRPTRPWIFNQLRRRFAHVYAPTTQPNHAEFPTDWTAAGHPCAARAVFVASRKPLDNPRLTTTLPDGQTRC